jgi:ubiquinone/menaquinone biosynthesis C-methylase UbiE
MLSIHEWHERFTRQAGWSASLRQYLYPRAGLGTSGRVLDVGSGTGALEADFSSSAGIHYFGVDQDLSRSQYAGTHGGYGHYACGMGEKLPYAEGVFDLVICHYLLLWVSQPDEVLREMIRVVKPGGCVLALSEPDHLGRVDWPEPFFTLGKRQTEALTSQGADVAAGRKLKGWFRQAGLDVVESGVMGGQWYSRQQEAEADDEEWRVLAEDLGINLDDLKANSKDRESRTASRVIYVPVFYALGRRV